MNAISEHNLKAPNWSTWVMFTLGFWLSASFILDLVVIPSLFASGMMAQSGFVNAGYLIFGVFNRLELVCGAIVLTVFLVFRRYHTLPYRQEIWSLIFATLLLAIALIDTYFLTPQMSGLGLSFHLFDLTQPMPPAMIYLHGGYWGLEIGKFFIGLTLLRWCYRESCPLT